MHKDIAKIVREISEADTEDFNVLARIACLTDRKSDFRDSDFSGVDFGASDLSGYDFTGSDLRGANLQSATIEKAVFDEIDADIDTKWPTNPPKTARLLDSYDPNWEREFDYHHEAHEKLLKKINNLHSQMEYDTGDAQDLADSHLKSMVDAELKSFRTIDDFVKARFWLPASEAEQNDIPYEMPVFDNNATLQDLLDEFSRFSKAITDAVRDKRSQAPKGRPSGLDIFEEGDDRHITSCYRRLEHPRLSLQWLILVSYDFRPTETHICLSFVPDEPLGMSVMNDYEHIIEVVYKEILVSAVEMSQERRSWWPKLRKRTEQARQESFNALFYPSIAVAPKNMHFYLYAPPSIGQEEFWRVSMQHHRGIFTEPKFEKLGCVPPYIAKVRLDQNFEAGRRSPDL